MTALHDHVGLAPFYLRDLGVRRTFLEVFLVLKSPIALFGAGIVVKALRGAPLSEADTTRKEVTTRQKMLLDG